MTTWSALGLGIGESTILTDGPAETMASFMVVTFLIWEDMEARRDAEVVVERREDESIEARKRC